MQKIKKIIAFLIAVVMAFSSAIAINVAADEGISISVGEASGSVGDTVTVSVVVEANSGFSFMTVTPSYDSAALKLVFVTNGSVCGSLTQGKNLVWNENGVDVEATGTLVSFSFLILDTATDGDYEISLTVRECYDAEYYDVACNVTSGKITVGCAHSFTKQVISDEYKKSDATATQKAVYYYCCEYCNERGEETFEYGETLGLLRGDVNGDLIVDLRDVIALRKYFAYYDYENQEPDPDYAVEETADVNGDGNINLFDLIALRCCMVT